MRRVTKHTNLHDDIKGKVEQQVTDGDGQQVRGKVVGSLYEAVGSPAERQRDTHHLPPPHSADLNELKT